MKLSVISNFPPPIGGIAVKAAELSSSLQKYTTIDVTRYDLKTTREGALRSIFDVPKMFLFVLRESSRSDATIFIASKRRIKLIGMPLILISRLLNLKVIIVPAGGTFQKDVYSDNFLRKWVAKKVLMYSDIVLTETKSMTANLKEIGHSNVMYFPNVRTPYNVGEKLSNSADSFVYVGQISREKGVLDILDSVRYLSVVPKIHLYGPFSSADIERKVNKKLDYENVSYKGIVHPRKIYETLSEYDVIILPSYYHDEGQPGILVESLMCGLPAITTSQGAIQDVINAECGEFVESQSPIQIAEKIEHITSDDEYFLELQNGAVKRSKKFSSRQWAPKLEMAIYNLFNS